MNDPGWKQFERRIARLFGGKRRGADYGGRSGGKNDCIVDGFSIECKLNKAPSYGLAVNAALQAEASAVPSEIPIGIVKRKKQLDKDALVVMRLETFMKWFGGGTI